MAGRNVGGWRDTAVTVVISAEQVGQMIEALSLAKVHVGQCLPLAPVNAAARVARIDRCVEVLGLALGEKIADQPNGAKWRELITDSVREYAVALWRGWMGRD